MKVKKTPKDKPSFVDFAIEDDDHLYWLASWYASVLGYKSLRTFKSNIEEAKRTCAYLNIDIEVNFIFFKYNRRKDYKLSKFACFLLALHSDGRKPMVRRARAYFLSRLDDMNVLLNDEDFLMRIIAREEIKKLNIQLNKSAAKRHVKDFQSFSNEGYLGMYNNTMPVLKQERNLDTKSNLSDYMSMTELAANIFRIALTTESLKKIRNPSEMKAAGVHRKIGTQIRQMIISNLGVCPEKLPLSVDLNVILKRLQNTQKELNSEVRQLK